MFPTNPANQGQTHQNKERELQEVYKKNRERFGPSQSIEIEQQVIEYKKPCETHSNPEKWYRFLDTAMLILSLQGGRENTKCFLMQEANMNIQNLCLIFQKLDQYLVRKKYLYLGKIHLQQIETQLEGRDVCYRYLLIGQEQKEANLCYGIKHKIQQVIIQEQDILLSENIKNNIQQHESLDQTGKQNQIVGAECYDLRQNNLIKFYKGECNYQEKESSSNLNSLVLFCDICKQELDLRSGLKSIKQKNLQRQPQQQQQQQQQYPNNIMVQRQFPNDYENYYDADRLINNEFSFLQLNCYSCSYSSILNSILNDSLIFS